MSVANAFSFLLQGYTPSIILAVAAVLLIIRHRFTSQLDPREPPVLEPKIPYIGHIIGMLTDDSAYFEKLYARKPMPISTLPMLNGKMYMITDPTMIQNALRHKNLSFDPFTLEFAQRMLGVSDETMIPVRFPGDEKNPGFLSEFVKEVNGAMIPQYLHSMNAAALNKVAVTFNGMGKTFETESLYYWLREVMTLATSDALLGSHNPLKSDPSLVDALWDFEGNLLGLLLNIFPSFTFPKAYSGRTKLQSALIKYYVAKHDLSPDVSQLAKARAALMRRRQISDIDIGKFELSLLHVSTANAIPTLFWNICFVAREPDTVAVIRKEVESIITFTPLEKGENGKGREAIIDISKFDSHCPVLASSYRETIRLANSQMGTRRVMDDTLLSLSDPNTNTRSEFLLRKGSDIQMPAGISHLSSSSWGPDSTSFSATRFLSPEEKGDLSQKARSEEREMKKAYMPFGGGKHLCPGRNFAFAEILGAVAVLVTGFDVKGVDGGLLQVPELGRARLVEAVAKPRGEGSKMGARFTRREGWEDVVWGFSC